MTPIFNNSCENPKIHTWCKFGNLVIWAQIHYKLFDGQAKFPIILRQNGQNYIEGQCQLPPFSITAESIPDCMLRARSSTGAKPDPWVLVMAARATFTNDYYKWCNYKPIVWEQFTLFKAVVIRCLFRGPAWQNDVCPYINVITNDLSFWDNSDRWVMRSKRCSSTFCLTPYPATSSQSEWESERKKCVIQWVSGNIAI